MGKKIVNKAILNLNMFLFALGITEFIVIFLVDDIIHKLILGMSIVICITIAISTEMIIKTIIQQKGDE